MTEFIWPIRVYYEDTDASGVVYHANYLRWFERGRTEWLRARGQDQQKLLVESGVAFTVARIEIQYRRPAHLDDQLEVATTIPHWRRASLGFHQVLRRPSDGVLLAEATVKVGCVDAAEFHPRALPDWLQPAQ